MRNKFYILNGKEVTVNEVIKEYSAWAKMKDRCYNTKCERYGKYGGRGITVCDEWLNSFQAFLNDMGMAPTQQHSLDRKDVNENYNKENCQWLLLNLQANNRTTTINNADSNATGTETCYEYNGVNKSVKQWYDDENISERIGITMHGFLSRFTKGWCHEDIFNVPAFGKRKHPVVKRKRKKIRGTNKNWTFGTTIIWAYSN